mgnify:CR=1 FL=1
MRVLHHFPNMHDKVFREEEVYYKAQYHPNNTHLTRLFNVNELVHHLINYNASCHYFYKLFLKNHFISIHNHILIFLKVMSFQILFLLHMIFAINYTTKVHDHL